MLLHSVCARRACASAASCDFSELISVVTSSVSSGEGHYVFSSLAAVCLCAVLRCALLLLCEMRPVGVLSF